MSANDQMAPDASPGEVTPKTGVRRVNNMPMYILFAVAAAFMVVMALVAANRAAQQNAPTEKSPELAGNTSMFAQEIAGEQIGGIIEPDQPPEVLPLEAAQPVDPTPNPEAKDQTVNPEVPLQRPSGHDQYGAARDEEAERIRMQKFQMLEEAVKAKTSVRIDAPSGRSSAGSSYSDHPRTREEMQARLAELRQEIDHAEDPTAAYQARLAKVQSMGIGGIGGMGGRGLSAAPRTEKTSPAAGATGYGKFAGTGQGDRWELNSRPEAPRTPYELRAGFVVPAILISGINSELPGQIMAQVSQNVYDTPTGRHLLVPQGSRLVGTYANDIAYGQARVLVAWQRIVFPDGKAMDIGAMPGADSAGYAGLRDKVNNHYIRIFGSALLMSAVTAGATYSQGEGDSNSESQRAGDVLSQALGQQLGQVTAQLIAKNMNIAPTLEIRPGFRLNVMVTKDLTFSKPYMSFDY